MRPIQTPAVRYDSFQLQGGLDLVTPTLKLPPGVIRQGINFEVNVTGGYSRIAGYERFDGRPSPAAATYDVAVLSSVAGLNAGDTIRNPAGSVTGVVFAIDGLEVYYTKQVGTFSLGDTVQVGATVIGTITSQVPATLTSYSVAVKSAGAADVYRADIGAVPGSGPIRGLAYLNDVLYAWRDNAGGTAMAIYKSTAGGWQAVSLGWELGFSGGTGTPIAEGNTITGATSGATAVVARVALESGTAWVGGSGRLILSSVTGSFGNGENIQVGGTTRAVTLTPGVQTAITLQPGGRVEAVRANMGGATGATRLYGADGVNRGFEFDGTTYAPIRVTGLSVSVDKPKRVAVHMNFLFFSFGGSVQFSNLGLPFTWSAVLGAGEIVMPEAVTALQVLPGSSTASLAIVTRNNISVLYGNTPGTWAKVDFDRGTGGWDYSVQQMADTYLLDDRGVVQLSAVDTYANFDSATLTMQLKPFINSRAGKATASAINREKSQYRIFFNDGFGLYLTIVNGTFLGAMPVYFPKPVNVWCEGETSAGTSMSFFGSGSDGYVYRMDTGPDFDGQGIEAWFRLNVNAQGATRVLKRYRRASLEVSGEGYSEFVFGYSLGYDSVDIGQALSRVYGASFFASVWDDFTWDDFIWDSTTLSPVEVECTGTAENIALQVESTSRYTQPFTVNSATLHFSVRRGIR